jgi:phage terminase small subunit
MPTKKKHAGPRPPTRGRQGIPTKQRRQKFALLVAAGKNATDAVLAVGGPKGKLSRPAARVKASQFMDDPDVQATINAAHQKALDYLQIDVNDYLEQLDAICRFDLADCYDEHGRLLSIHKMPKKARMALAGMEVIMKNAKAGDGKIDEVLKIRPSSKIEALVAMLKVRGQLVNRTEKGKPGDFAKMTREEVLDKLQNDTLPKLGLRLVKDAS